MRKLFFAIYFICLLIPFSDANAASKAVSDMEANMAQKQKKNFQLSKEVEAEKQKTRSMSREDMDGYLKKRLMNVVITQMNGDNGLNGDGAISVEKSADEIAKEQASKQSLFEKIYSNAMNRLISPTDKPKTAPIYKYTPNAAEVQQRRTQMQKQQMENWARANLDVIDIALPPNGEKTLVPAKEHIPYLFSKIEVLPDGLIRFTDTITVVANGKKLKKGVIRAFPKYVVTRLGEKQKTDFNLLYVTINGTPVEYNTLERGNYFFIEPDNKADLPTGVYTYEFSYLLDNQVFQYDEFDEFYWDLTGSVWNLIIARAGAAVVLPPNTQTLGQTALSGFPGSWRNDTVKITQESRNVIGFVSQTPLFVSQGMQMIISIPKGAISNTNFDKRITRFINAYGDNLFALFGFLAIVIAYILSWRYIQKNKNTKISGLTKDSPILRYLSKGLIDKKSFGSFLLDLKRKNIIDIEENDDNILLVRRSDNVNGLTKAEKKALNNLFTNSESVLNINSYSALKVKRAFENIQKGIKQKIMLLSLKLNLGYLLFSLGMLLLTEIAIASLGYDIIYNFLFMFFCTLVYAVCLGLFHIKFKRAWVRWSVRIEAFSLLALDWFVLCSVINPPAAFLILLTVGIIIGYSKLYAQRGGLLRASVSAAAEYRQQLIKKADDINICKDFAQIQAAVYALDLEESYQKCSDNPETYKLDIIDKMVKKI